MNKQEDAYFKDKTEQGLLAKQVYNTMLHGCPHGMGDTMTGCSDCYSLLNSLIKVAISTGEGYQKMSNAIQNNKVH